MNTKQIRKYNNEVQNMIELITFVWTGVRNVSEHIWTFYIEVFLCQSIGSLTIR